MVPMASPLRLGALVVAAVIKGVVGIVGAVEGIGQDGGGDGLQLAAAVKDLHHAGSGGFHDGEGAASKGKKLLVGAVTIGITQCFSHFQSSSFIFLQGSGISGKAVASRIEILDTGLLGEAA